MKRTTLLVWVSGILPVWLSVVLKGGRAAANGMLKDHRVALFVGLAGFLFMSPAAFGATYYVPDETNGIEFIQDGLDRARSGDTVIVRDGAYGHLWDVNLDFKGKAVTLRSENGPENCVIDCHWQVSWEGEARAFWFHTSETSSSVVDGFTIVNGSTSGPGGAIACDGASPTIRNCIIRDNSTEDRGGAIWCSHSIPSITDCIISGNAAGTSGGAVYCESNSSALLVNCTISENTAQYYGGGIYCIDSRFTMINCTVGGNRADRAGGAVRCYNDSYAAITSCVFWGNSAVSGPEITLELRSSATVQYSDVEGGEGGVEVGPGCTLNWLLGNIDGDPRFVGQGNYHLTAASPCIDTGINTGVLIDIDGQQRPWPSGGVYDMGSDEFTVRYYYVPDDFATIQDALDTAADGSVITVRDGTYTGSRNKDLDYKGKAITLRSESGPRHCAIDCEGEGRGFYFHSRETAYTVLDGFTIIRGAPRHGTVRYGGGILCEGSSPAIANCIIVANSAEDFGGGIYCSDSSPIITDSIMSRNSAGFDGGGVYCRQSAPRISKCVISENSGVRCGGIYCYGYPSPAIENCIITGNSADDHGGGIFCSRGVINIFNCTIIENTANHCGGAICGYSYARPTIHNSILWGDSASVGPEMTLTKNSSCTISHSNVEGGASAVDVWSGCVLDWGEGNIEVDPLFVGGGDYHLTSSSPCIDTGTHGVALPHGDFEGQPRIADGDRDGIATVDMGADEYFLPPIPWARAYGGAARHWARSVRLAVDGGYVVAGGTSPSGAGDNDLWVLKLNSTGAVAWQKAFGGSGDEWAYCIQQTEDGGYITAGYTDSLGEGSYDIWLLKLNPEGAVDWQKTYGGIGYDRAFCIRQTSDAGYIVAGFTTSFGAGSTDLWVLKLDPDGTVLWQNTYGGSKSEWAYSVEETLDGGYVVAGWTSSFGGMS
ncbi:MAG: hypothetical protein JRJ26_19970 [Deltaproteobacteria bacterium]|nr:hypothetical protein [Deltaproteobacteria bacterium]